MKKSAESNQKLSSSELSGTDAKRTELKNFKGDEKTRPKHNSREIGITTKTKEKHKFVNLTSTQKILSGIDSNSGVSFAEALVMCGTNVSSKNSKKKKLEITNVEREENEVNIPTLLKQPNLEPLNINSSLLPKITPFCRPLPIGSRPRSIVSKLMMCRNHRTKVYSGIKSHGKVETLFDICMRVLQNNIDALEYTGGVPYIILKPVLEQAKASQLFKIEHHNPYLVEDTDHLWKRHCEKEFWTKSKEELESRRDMYIRCLDERETRLNIITNQSQYGERSTKLAYVDSVVKLTQDNARKRKRRKKKKRKLGTYKISNIIKHRYPEDMIL